MGHSGLFFLYFPLYNIVDNRFTNVQDKIRRSLYSNRGSQMSEATALPTELQPLPCNVCLSDKVSLWAMWPDWAIFERFWVSHFVIKVTQIFEDFRTCFEKHHYLRKICCSTFGTTLVENWPTFDSIIWSHCLRVQNGDDDGHWHSQKRFCKKRNLRTNEWLKREPDGWLPSAIFPLLQSHIFATPNNYFLP